MQIVHDAHGAVPVQTMDLLQANHAQILQFVTAKLHPGLNRAFQEAGTPYNDQGPQPQVLGDSLLNGLAVAGTESTLTLVL